MNTRHDPLSLHVLASGSSGNISVVRGGGCSLLLDAGLSARRSMTMLASQSIDPNSLHAILVTHEHSDHIAGARVLSRRLGIPVYMTAGTARAAGRHAEGIDVRVISAGEHIDIGPMSVSVFRIEHDAAEPVGYTFEDSTGARVGVVTDTGRLTEDATDALQDCTVLGLECNHDVTTLEEGPYPWFLKQRILSSRGHLSNDDAAQAVVALAGPRLRHVVALHLSDTNNTAEMARSALSTAAESAGRDTTVTVCPKGAACATAVCA